MTGTSRVHVERDGTERVPGGGSEFVGLENYKQMLAEAKFWEALQNNFLWLLVVPAASTAFGLLAAQLTDRRSSQ